MITYRNVANPATRCYHVYRYGRVYSFVDIALAPIYASLGKRSDVLNHLKNAVDQHVGFVLLNYAEQLFDDYRYDPEFRELFRFFMKSKGEA